MRRNLNAVSVHMLSGKTVFIHTLRFIQEEIENYRRLKVVEIGCCCLPAF
jgi:hypothetical protein